jgi:hypothetical protein
MTYTDEDIQDLYTDLLGIGLAETPAEEATRARELLERGITMGQASQILSDNRIPHTFYTALWAYDKGIGIDYRSNWILVRGLTVFYSNRMGVTGPTVTCKSLPSLKKKLQEFNCLLISEANYTDVNLLPKAGQI